MQVQDHRLVLDNGDPVRFEASPNQGGALKPRFLVMHYTAGRDAESSIRWLTRSDARASAHLVIARDGAITQLVPFDRVAWHAGPSRWQGVSGLNHHSIGIELDNAGLLERKGERWCAWFGTAYPAEEVMEAPLRGSSRICGWHLYTPEQLDVALEASRAIIHAYGLRELLGHDDISPGRKFDPGPAFPMGSFRAKLFGRAEDEAPTYATTVNLNIRRGPGTHHDRLDVSPLPKGTPLEVLREDGSWRQVNVRGEVQGQRDIQGWVHGDYIRRSD
ncbi:MAG: N-acetylmuramoyl-L-alanine amidase [Gemmatimonadales bacterium]|nr:MAG: N-acetylmuramoyl-L-alanine amidase [Gemmatimonadales bacterium]